MVLLVLAGSAAYVGGWVGLAGADLADSLGAAVATLSQENAWTQRRPAGRGMIITANGAGALAQRLNVLVPAWSADSLVWTQDQLTAYLGWPTVGSGR